MPTGAPALLRKELKISFEIDYLISLKDLHLILFIDDFYRSGSSFAGEILSASPNASFIFEPLYRFEPFGHPVDVWSTWNASVRAHVEERMESLFDCDNVIIN